MARIACVFGLGTDHELENDKAPLILGFAELLEELKLFSDPTTNTAWLEEP